MKKALLCIDDDSQILISLNLLLSDHFDVIISTDPSWGLELLKMNPRIIAVICDYRMPKYNGAQFFHEINNCFPYRKLYKIIYSGYVDKEQEVNDMIRKGMVDKFMLKTTPPKELIHIVIDGAEGIKNGEEIEKIKLEFGIS